MAFPPLSRALCALACSATTAAALSLLPPPAHSGRDSPPPGVPTDFWDNLLPSVRPGMNYTASGWHLGRSWSRSQASGVAADPCAGLDLSYESDHTLVMTCRGGTVCIGGVGFQSRAASTTSMILEAVELLRGRGTRLRDFTRRLVEITDDGISSCKGTAFTYTLPWDYLPGSCTSHLIPDFTMWAFPEAGLLPNFTVLTGKLRGISRRPPRRRKCGFAGSTRSSEQRGALYERQQQPDVGPLLEVVATDHQMERWSVERQAEEWACMVDVAGQAYSRHVPMLLHTGRPLLMVERRYVGAAEGHFLDRMWYSVQLEPDVHYIPVFANLSNLVPALRKALSKEGEAIGRNAQRFAAESLTTERSVEYIADLLVLLSD